MTTVRTGINGKERSPGWGAFARSALRCASVAILLSFFLAAAETDIHAASPVQGDKVIDTRHCNLCNHSACSSIGNGYGRDPNALNYRIPSVRTNPFRNTGYSSGIRYVSQRRKPGFTLPAASSADHDRFIHAG